MDSMESLPSSVGSHLSAESLLDTDVKPSPEHDCMVQGEASAEIGNEMTNSSIQWPINLEMKQEHNKDDDYVPRGTGLYQWFDNQALSEEASSINVDHIEPPSASIQEILEASRLSKNKDLLQLLGEIGSDDSSTFAGSYWQEVGGSDYNSQNADYSVSGTNECTQFQDAQNFRTFLEPMPLVVPSLPGAMSSYNVVQSGDNIIWTGQNDTDTGRGVTLECIQAGEAFPFVSNSSTSQEFRDISDDIRKQEEKKRKRRERNKQCSREFRRKQKVREQLLTRGKAEKEQILVERYKRIEKTTKILNRIATSSGACEKGQGIINMVAGLINKENLFCSVVKGNRVANRPVSHTQTQAF
ncbi:uncharacterized protein LOC111327951 [Stylophora pistillata]|uniref:BZIP domain-containing protein n=1 Tax=Stylophora pistillata TaxID=50429 RepID=A0A2B4SBC2_STYPI|nr:uncharacterized protein LOC111327951 [Stylophora pistillata]PFX27181.1 hypothetical protein AWC38_SpisGene8134 [Stylophora pistillata]